MIQRPASTPGSFLRSPSLSSACILLFLTSAGIGTVSLSPAQSPPPPASKGGFFSRKPKPTEKPAAEETSQPTARKATSGTTPPSPGSQSAPAPATRSVSGESKTARRGVPKKAGDPKSEDELFFSVRLKALEDPTVGELRSKADKAKDKDSGVSATRAYLKGLYAKMRDLEPTLKERIDLTETAALSGLAKTP